MLYGVWYMVYGVWFMVHGVWCMVYGVWCMVHGVLCMVYGVSCLVHGAWCMVHGASCIVHRVWFMVYGVWCTAEFCPLVRRIAIRLDKDPDYESCEIVMSVFSFVVYGVTRSYKSWLVSHIRWLVSYIRCLVVAGSRFEEDSDDESEGDVFVFPYGVTPQPSPSLSLALALALSLSLSPSLSSVPQRGHPSTLDLNWEGVQWLPESTVFKGSRPTVCPKLVRASSEVCAGNVSEPLHLGD